MSSNKQAVAKNNGNTSEKVARHYLESKGFNVSHLDLIYDLLINGKYFIEVKSCQKTVIDSTHSNNTRSGRYTFTREQDDYLKTHSGVYLFLMHTNDWYSDMTMIKATDLPFKQQRTHKNIFDLRNKPSSKTISHLQTIFASMED